MSWAVVMANIGAASQTTTHAYDIDNNEITTTDPRSKVYHHAFDALNRLYQETDPDHYHDDHGLQRARTT